MAKMTTEDLMGAFEEMTVLELKEFLDAFEERFDVTAAAPMAMAVAGGEDYELLFTGSRNAIDRLRERIDVPLTEIGEMVEDESNSVRLLDAEGREVDVGMVGFDHLRGAR